MEGRWPAGRRGPARPRTEQPTCSVLNRATEREVLPVRRRYGVGTPVWSPLVSDVLAGRHREGRPPDGRRSQWGPKHLTDERALDLVEQLIALAREAGCRSPPWRRRSP
ncbi:aldo/keto reductase [Streptomyces sp. DH37]|uniref:aldo/keto reductase n=1 Tax=Streptomyces sp. DH37 TaxID=3040122 RepID=UPI0024425E6C|nr:aldo/keto reductase [Streptomyces sp. DH37]MDG9701641.1 hypothetical protein [Streptomyces sp. DH37]